MHFRAFPRALALVAVAAIAPACRESAGPASAGAARNIAFVSAGPLSAPVGAEIPDSLVVRVTDSDARPVRGARVEFRIAFQMGTLSPETATTDARGEARTKLTLGPVAGRVDVTAMLAGTDSSAQMAITATPGAAAQLSLVPDRMWLSGAGQMGRIFGNDADQFGNTVGGSTITWQSLDESVATVDAAGVVVGQQAGATARVVATSARGFVDTVLVSVADPNTPVCPDEAAALAVGQSITMDARAGTCLRAAAGAEYVAVPYFASAAPNSQTDVLRIIGTGVGGPAGSAALVAPTLTPGPAPERPMQDFAFEHGLREKEQREIAPLAAASRAARAARAGAPASFNAVPATVREGDVLTLNASPTHGCSFPDDAARRADTRRGRVVAITQRAIVIADTTNPAAGFTDADYRRLAMTFDTLVAPLMEQYFGTASDIDRNGRSVLFFTNRVNELSPSTGSYIGGFFWSRDLLDRAVCPTGNAAEIFYMMVPDPTGLHGASRSKAFVEEVTVGTLGHEYQHLINASRRMANAAADPSEVTWLNEGLSHIAEELLFYRVTGLQPRQNIGGERFGSAPFEQAYFSYQHNNITRLERWLTAPNTNSPFGTGDGLATRGAAWAYLRYLADRSASAESELWYRLVNNLSTGMANVEDVFGTSVVPSVREWTVAMYADDYGLGLAPEHRMPSWNFRSLYPAAKRGAYPLRTTVMLNNTQHLFTLRGGGAAYYPFAPPTGVDSKLWLTTTNGSAQPPVRVTILRTR